MRLLLWTQDDPASRGIASALIEAGHFPKVAKGGRLRFSTAQGAELARVDGSLLTADFANRAFDDPDCPYSCALFLSKHAAASGITAFTVHPIGNLGPGTDFGGAPRTLAPPDCAPQTDLLRALSREASALGISATFEATHHGPQMDIPSAFVEVGSGPKDWENPAYCEAVARAVVEGFLSNDHGPEGKTAIGLGGGHYHPRHTDLAREEGTLFGHLIPAYALARATEDTLRAAAAQTKAASVVVDRRAEPAAVDRAAGFFESLGLSRVDIGK